MTRGKDRKSEVSRRDFIKEAAIATGAAALGPGLIGSALAQAPPSAAAAAPEDKKYAWETPPAPIPAQQIKNTVTADVVVIGCGTAGINAAYAASKTGAKVVLIEKTATVQARGGDNAALNTKLHKKLGITIDKSAIIDRLMERGEGRLDQNMLNLWADNCGPIMDEIIDVLAAENVPTYLVIPDRGDDQATVIDRWPDFPGAPAGGWKYMEERYPEFPTTHRPGGIGESQRVWLPVMLKKAQSQGTEVFYNTKAVQLVRDGDKGRVTAVIAQNQDKTYTKFSAKRALCLCTGDIGANREMRQKYTPTAMQPTMVRTGMGEGHQMAMWIGGQMEEAPMAPMVHNFYVIGSDAFLQVNKYGRRFFNEDCDTEHLANQSWEQGGIWVVFDDSWEEDIKFMGPGFKKWFRVNDKTRQEMKDMLAGKSGGQYGHTGTLSAGTIEELGAKMRQTTPSLDVATFKRTIARYNELAKLGKDLDYGKVASRMTAIDQPPYYAEWSPKPNWALVLLAGIIVNERLQPVDKDGDPIPGIFLAGNTVGRRFKGGYPLVVPGISHSMAWTFGHLAGKYAAENV